MVYPPVFRTFFAAKSVFGHAALDEKLFFLEIRCRDACVLRLCFFPVGLSFQEE